MLHSHLICLISALLCGIASTKIYRPRAALIRQGLSEVPGRWLVELHRPPAKADGSAQAARRAFELEMRRLNVTMLVHGHMTTLLSIIEVELARHDDIHAIASVKHIKSINPVYGALLLLGLDGN